MSHSNSSGNFSNNANNINLNANIMNKFSKINRQNFKTISINNTTTTTNYTKYNHSKDNIQLTNNGQEKKKKSSSNKKVNNKKEKKNYIPKIKTDIINSQNIQLIQNIEGNAENINNNNNNLNNISNNNQNNLNNFKNKKEYQINRHNSSHQRSNDLYDKNSKEINLLRKKLLKGSNNISHNNNSNSNKYIPRSNERLTNSDNNNNNINSSGNKLIKRSNTNSNLNENFNMNFSIEINKYKNIIKVLLYYIENLNKKIKYFFNKNQIEKNNKIKELSLQNKFLLNENKTLKIKIIHIFYILKYLQNGKKLYDEKYHKLTKELMLENNFLRGINILSKNINNEYLSQLKKQIQIEKFKKELLIHHQFINKTDINTNDNNTENKNNNKDINNNPFIYNETSLNNINNKISHKRQRTHFNLGKLNDDNNNSSIRDSIGSSTNNNNLSNEQSSVSANTVIDNKDKDKDKELSFNKNIKNINNNNNKNENIFCETLKEMSNYNKTLKKMNNNSKKNLLENKNENNVGDIKINKLGNKMVYNIPYKMNKNENVNIHNDKGEIWKNNKSEIKKDLKKNNDYFNDRINDNENIANRKQQSIYYRAVREKDKKKIEFTK